MTDVIYTFEQAKERITKLEACLIRVAKLAWSAVKDERDAVSERMNTMEWTLKEMEKVGLDKWLPSFDDMRGILNQPDESWNEATVRRERRAIDAMLRAME